MILLLSKLLQGIKPYTDGFPCITKLNNHYTEASHRIFVNTSNGIVTLFWFEDTGKVICKSKSFLKIIEKVQNERK